MKTILIYSLLGFWLTGCASTPAPKGPGQNPDTSGIGTGGTEKPSQGKRHAPPPNDIPQPDPVQHPEPNYPAD